MRPLIHRAWKLVAALAGVVAATPFAAKWLGRRMFAERVEVEVRQMLAAAIDGDDRMVTEEDLDGLPSPVKRYLRFAGVVGRPRIRTARIKQVGALRIAPEQPWQQMTADQHYAVFPIGFVWHGLISSGLFSIEVRDAYFAGYGEVLAKLASVVPVAEARGPEVDEGALVRYLAEMVFFPTAFIDQVRWEPIDDESARVFFADDELEVSAVSTFDPATGRMVSMVAERWRDEDGYFRKYAWSTPFDDYSDFGGFVVPSSAAAIWHLGEDEDSEFEYARFEVLEVEFDVEPEQPSSERSIGTVI